MKNVLTDEEIVAIDDDMFEQSKVTRMEFARAIEAAVLAKFGEPVAHCFNDSGAFEIGFLGDPNQLRVGVEIKLFALKDRP